MLNLKQQKTLKQIGLIIYQERKRQKVSRTTIAIQLYTDEKQIRRVENGEVNATIITLLKICFVLKINITDLLDFKITPDFLDEHQDSQ